MLAGGEQKDAQQDEKASKVEISHDTAVHPQGL